MKSQGMASLRTLFALLVFSGVAYGAHLVSLHALPRFIMHRVMSGVVPVAHETRLPALASDTSRAIVMPSPDLLYAVCKLDLRKGAVRVTAAPASEDYWSIALYDMKSDNFFVRNDRQLAGKGIDLIVLPAGPGVDGKRLPEGADSVRAPGDEVLLLMRLLVRDRSPETLARLEKDRSTLNCQPLADQVQQSADSLQGAPGGAADAANDSAKAIAPVGIDAESWSLAQRGFIARPSGQVRDADGKVIWDYDSFDFLEGSSPASVNPSLWRMALLNNRIGLFKVTEGIWQLRGFDLANMTLIAGETGWIVVDPLTSRETAQAAMAFATKHLGERPVSAVIFTHSHVDHFGGVLGVVSEREIEQRKIPVIAPAGFMEEATSENIMVGQAMGRRSMFMYGSNLPRNAKGMVDNALGKAPAYGSFGIVPPTRLVEQKTEEVRIDGRRFVFHNVPGSEAPSEFVFHLPDMKAFGGAELFAHTLHNIYTLRGAKVRDALKWSRYMDDVRVYADKSEVMFNQHNWPVWGRDAILQHISLQRDVYRYLHDQTVRLMNQGLIASEIAETLTLPPELDAHLSTRGYYGTVRHNIKGIYQFYLGWYDGHPSNLDPLPPREAAKRYAAMAGGVDALIEQARKAHDSGDVRWAAELGKHAVLAAPDNARAREQLARSFELLGWKSEATTWRNAYLTGAQELREGKPKSGIDRKNFLDMLKRTPVERFLESMAAALNPQRAEGVDLRINLVFTDTGEMHALHVRRSILNHETVTRLPPADATLKLTKAFFIDMLIGEAGGVALLTSKQTAIDGSAVKLGQFFRLLDKPDPLFPIVTR